VRETVEVGEPYNLGLVRRALSDRVANSIPASALEATHLDRSAVTSALWLRRLVLAAA